MTDVVNHPSHYAKGWSNGAEVIDITENLNFNRGNAVKYIARSGRKDPTKEVEDLRKARWYIDRELLLLGVSPDPTPTPNRDWSHQIKPGDTRRDWRDFPEGTRFTDAEGDVFVRVEPYTGTPGRNDGVRWAKNDNDGAWAIHWNTESYAPYTVVESG